MRPLLASLTRDLAREQTARAIAHVEATDPNLRRIIAMLSVPDPPPSGEVVEHATDDRPERLGSALVPVSTQRRA